MSSDASYSSSLASALIGIFQAASALEASTIRTSTQFYSAHSSKAETLSPDDSVSQVTVSQVTVTNPRIGLSPSTTLKGSVSTKESSKGGGRDGPQAPGLPNDPEGKETRKEMLARRRKECSAEEVDVALAPVMKINVPYVFYPEQYKQFRKLFPRINVDSGLSYVHHDHPVAHTATMVGIRYVQGMLQGGETALDLFGNPNGNEQFNFFQQSRHRKRPHLMPAKIETLVKEHTAMDAVRRITKWGEKFAPDGRERFIEGDLDDIPTGLYTTFLSIHTLYYMSQYQVCKLLNLNPKAKLVAVVNYSKEQAGTLYGELQFSKSGGMTNQTSPNGESYRHPDIDQWFQTNSFRPHTDPFGGGIAWTSHQIGGPLYALTITRCDWALARTGRYDPPGAPTLAVQKDRSFLGMVRIGGKNVQLRVTNADLAAELRHWMTFRDRNDPQVFKDLVVKAKRVTATDIIDGSRQYKVNDGELQDHILYSYLVDAPGELELMDGIKLLQGDLLQPLAKALQFDGDENKTPLVHAMFQWLIGEKEMTKGLGQRASKKPTYTTAPKNSGGLLPFKRT